MAFEIIEKVNFPKAFWSFSHPVKFYVGMVRQVSNDLQNYYVVVGSRVGYKIFFYKNPPSIANVMFCEVPVGLK